MSDVLPSNFNTKPWWVFQKKRFKTEIEKKASRVEGDLMTLRAAHMTAEQLTARVCSGVAFKSA